jgi:glycosyltransferase involved in cell wall biosynthesis
MKVALVHSYYSSRQPSGENVVVESQATALREHGVDVRIIAAHTDELEVSPGYKFRSALGVATGRGRSPIAELKKFSPDVVHVHNLFPNWGTAWLEEWNGPITATVHNFRPVCAAGTLFRDGSGCTLCPDSNSVHAVRHACYRDSKMATLPLAIRNRGGVAGDRLLSRADCVILLSARARDLYSGFGLPMSRSVVIPNFVDDVGYNANLAPGDEWVYIGRLTAEKGILNLLKHWPSNEILKIYGDGPLRSEVERTRRPNVKYLGHVNHGQVPAVLAQARGLVFPSQWAEGLPLIYAEALASGRLVVAKSGNSAADDVAAAGTGEVFQDWGDMRGALSRAKESPLERSAAARRHFERSFSRDVWLERTLNLYRTLSQGTCRA